MSEQEKKQQRIYDLLNAKTKPKTNPEIIFVYLWPVSNPDLNPLAYTIWGHLENKTNATFHLNIGLLKSAIEEEWNKMSEEFEGMEIVLKAFWWNNWKKNGGHTE